MPPIVDPVVVEAKLEAGATVTDANGAAVGTISSVDGEFVILKTDKYEARLPAASFSASGSGFLFGMTQAALNAEIESSLPKPADFVKVGVTVRDTAGGIVGTVSEVDTEYATIQLASTAVKLALTAFGAGPNGPIVGVTAAELEAEVATSAQ
ncbi:MAG: preprotein translocase subunit YajC [Pseudomonadota bacterium]|nr:preprotein translocase subunit YajC [Pseudomonadota bacterium]